MKSCGRVFSRRGGWSCIAIAFVLLIGQACVAEQYIPPIGIPAPPFGINESHTMYAGQYYAAGGFNYRDAGNGPYTHYVDSTDPTATNVGNPYGTAATPRASLPLGTLAAGSVVEIHGGPFVFNNDLNFLSQGTAADPVFIRGVDVDSKAVIHGTAGTHVVFRVSGSYAIVENLHMTYGVRFQAASSSDHISIRYCEVDGPDGVALAGGTSVLARSYSSYIVMYHNHIHHNVRLDSGGNPEDSHGTSIQSGAHHIWILDNEIHHNSGDAFQAAHNASPSPHHVYIGRNVMHDDRENGVDLKNIHDVVVSQNVIYSYLPSTYLGDAVVVGSMGVGTTDGPHRSWLLFNDIWNCKNGIRIEGARDCYIIGNTIRQASGNAIQLDIDPDSQNVNIVSNTLVGIGSKGIAYGWKEAGASGFSFANNIFRNIGIYHVDVPAFVASTGELRNNLFWDSGANISIRWGSSTYNGLDPAGVNALPDSSGNVIGDPLLVDIPGADFHIQEGSAAANAAIVSAVYQEFFDLYGIDIKLDYDGLPRPQEGLWDIGAFELPVSTVVGRYVFYNNSAFDGDDPAANASDDGALAPDKTALLPGGTATFANYTSYSPGINGVMVDIENLPATPSVADFAFKVGNDNSPGAWPTAPAPTSVTVRAGAGAGGSDRVTIIWPDNAIERQWLRVTVKATGNTGLATPDVFYFGNAIGETGNSPSDAEVTPTDEIAVRNGPHTLALSPAAIDDTCDFNRDRKVGPTDAIIVRDNGTSSPTALQLITVP